MVNALPAFEPVVAAATPKGIVAFTADQRIAGFSAAEHHMVDAGKAQVIVYTVAIRVLADHHRADCLQDEVVMDGVGHVLQALVQFQNIGRGEEQRAGQMGRIGRFQVGVAHCQLGPRVAFELVEQVRALRTAEVVEAVTCLQLLDLGFEDEGEGRTEQAVEGHLLFGKTANPEVDQVETGFLSRPGARPVEEVERVSRCSGTAKHEVHRCIPLFVHGHGVEDVRVLTIGGDEVDHRSRGLDRESEIKPAAVGFQLGVAGLREEIGTDRIQRRHAGITGASDVQRREIERQADQIVPQRVGDIFVDLVADLTGHAADDGTCRRVRVGAGGCEGDGVEEGLDQTHVGLGLAVRADRRHGFIELRVAEAVDRVSELGSNRRVDINSVREDERIDVRVDQTDELFEHEVLVDLFGGEAGSLEQALAVPLQRGEIGRDLGDLDEQPLVEQRHIAIGDQFGLDLVNTVVVFGMEHVVDRGESDVLVPATVADDIVLVEQLVVIGRTVATRVERDVIAHIRIGIGSLAGFRIGIVCNVRQEDMAGRQGAACRHRRGQVAFNQRVRPGHELREAIRARNEVAIKVGGKQRNVMNVHVAELDAQLFPGLQLDVGPGRRSAVCAFEEPAGGDRLAVDQLVFAQEHLMRFIRGIGLVEVDPRGRVVGSLTDVISSAENAVCTGLIGRAGQDHEVGGAARDIKRVIRLQRDEHRATATLVDHGQAVIEELAEDGHEPVERRGAAQIGHDVRQNEVAVLHLDTGQRELRCGLDHGGVARRIGCIARLSRFLASVEFRTAGGCARGEQRSIGNDQRLVSSIGRTDRDPCGFGSRHDRVVECAAGDADIVERRDHRDRVAERLVGDEVGDDTRFGVIDGARQACVAGRLAGARIDIRGIPDRSGLARHQLIRRSGGLVDEIVVLAAHGPQAVRSQSIQRITQMVNKLTSCSVVLGDFDLLQNVNEIIDVQFKHSLYSPYFR